MWSFELTSQLSMNSYVETTYELWMGMEKMAKVDTQKQQHVTSDANFVINFEFIFLKSKL